MKKCFCCSEPGSQYFKLENGIVYCRTCAEKVWNYEKRKVPFRAEEIKEESLVKKL